MRKTIYSLALASILAVAGSATAAPNDDTRPTPTDTTATDTPTPADTTATGTRSADTPSSLTPSDTATDTRAADTASAGIGTADTRMAETAHPQNWTFDLFGQRWCVGDLSMTQGCDVTATSSPALPALSPDQQDAILSVPEPLGSWLTANVDETSG
ncbi:MAG TPA: hypothetical protein VHE35_15345 [Kofleriaceae bacterium]|nr:hypothetical protein [Kofleriaceae bacterium]